MTNRGYRSSSKESDRAGRATRRPHTALRSENSKFVRPACPEDDTRRSPRQPPADLRRPTSSSMLPTGV